MANGAPTVPYVHDLWAPLSYLIGDGRSGVPRKFGAVPGWIPDDDARRLSAYQVLDAYTDNVRRYWLPKTMWDVGAAVQADGSFDAGKPAGASYREYAHPAFIVDTARALMLGDSQSIDIPAIRDATEPPQQFVAVKEWLEKWSADERLEAKLLEIEEAVIGKGDGVFTLSWSPNARRPRLRVYDPGMFFPDWSSVDLPDYVKAGWDDEDFPPIVHIAWEYENQQGEQRVRRSTWQMVPLDAPRTYAYGSQSTWACVYSSGDWPLAKLNGENVYTLKLGRNGGDVLQAPIDLGIDFIPLIHIPNDYPGCRRWGRSILLRITQIFDDLSSADTDLAVNAAVVASPALVTKATGGGSRLETGPGAWFDLQQGGDAQLLDTSRTLVALIQQGRRLEETLATRSRLGQVLLGMISPNEVPSGFAMRLGFVSAEQLEREMRLIRTTKYGLLLKFAARLAIVGKALNVQALPDIEMNFGPGLPVDRSATIEEVQLLITAQAISIETAVQMLVEAGLPIEDAEAEVTRIKQERINDAIGIVEATGDIAAARARLGLTELPPGGPNVNPPRLIIPGRTPPAPAIPGNGGGAGG